AATGVSSLQLTYTYSSTGTDNNGNVLTETSAIGTNIFAQTFVYDSLNRLTSAYEIDNGGSTPAWQQAYVYDRYGNRQLHNDGSTTSPPDVTFNQKNQIVGMTYDASGNLTNDGRHTYFFNAENMMTGFDSVPNDYEYDGEGNRVKNSSISSYMIYDIEDKLIQEVSLNTCFTRTCRQSQLPHLLKEHVYGADGVLSTIVPNGAAEYLTPDHLGTPRVVTDANTGTVLSWHDYQPFGEEITATSPAAGARSNITQFDGSNNPRQKFTSKERDTETGLDFFNARYYSNAQGRFTSADSSRLSMRLRDPQSWNRYAYVLNNPLIYIDPSGLVFVRNNNTGQIYFYDNIKSQEQATKELGKQFEVVTGAYIDAAAAASLQSQGYKVKVGQQVTLSANGHISLDGNGEPNTTSHAGVPLFPTERQFVKLPLIVFTAESTPLALGFITLTGVGSTTLGLSSSFTVDEAVSLGLLNGTSKLAQVLRTIQSGFNAANPSSMLESMKILNQAVESLGLGPGVVVEGGPTAGYITLQNVGGVLTTILSTGEIVVTKGGDVLMRLKP
ncbi:MAG TPA: RHS repeat-associated core domain-containing protein, partial [Blastocatellia bacterium]|nr:RHS repeat-associated core domain-containing protein [Blastocatellia bacterium]